MSVSKEEKLKAYIVEPVEEDWSMVNQTEYFENGRWVIGMNLITSLEDVMKRAYKKKIAVLPQSMFEEKDNLLQELNKPKE